MLQICYFVLSIKKTAVGKQDALRDQICLKLRWRALDLCRFVDQKVSRNWSQVSQGALQPIKRQQAFKTLLFCHFSKWFLKIRFEFQHCRLDMSCRSGYLDKQNSESFKAFLEHFCLNRLLCSSWSTRLAPKT